VPREEAMGMASIPTDDGLGPDLDDADLETLRSAFVEAFNARDLDRLLELVATDAELPDTVGEGHAALADELGAIWERSPVVVLTDASVRDAPAAVAWLPDERGHWTRVALVTFDGEDGQLTVIELLDDADTLHAALTDGPVGDVVDEELDWSTWAEGAPRGDGDGDWYERHLPESWES
jgi:hypothetical protein